MKYFNLTLLFTCLCIWLQAQTPAPCTHPWPLNRAVLEYNTAVRFVCNHHTPQTIDGEIVADSIFYEFYLGKTSRSLEKVGYGGDILLNPNMLYGVSANDFTTVVSFLYTPETPLETGKTYFWRVDAINSQDTVRSAVWRFTAGDGTLVDVGQIFNETRVTPTDYPPLSGVGFVGTVSVPPPLVVNKGGELEMTFTPNAGNIGDANGIGTKDTYFPSQPEWPTNLYFRATGTSGIDAAMTGSGNMSKMITKVIIIGTSDQISSRPNPNSYPGILFSNMMIFDENSIIGYSQIELHPVRLGYAYETIVEAPAGTKSFRVVCGNVRLTEVEEDLYRIDTAGDISLRVERGARITYIGAILRDYINISVTTDPVPGDGIRVRLHDSIQLSWQLLDGETANDFKVYAGNISGAMTKIKGVVKEVDGSFSITYTPETPFISEKFHYWRVDAVKGDSSVEGRIWRFIPVALNEDELVDLGLDFDGTGNSQTAKSNVAITNGIRTVYGGTKKEVTFTPMNATFDSNNAYLAHRFSPAWTISENGYVNITMGKIASDKNTFIKRLIINGTDDGTKRTSPVVLFSDKPAFEDGSVLGKQQITLGIYGAGSSDLESHRGQASMIVEAPAGSKSARIYHSDYFTQKRDTHSIDTPEDTIVTRTSPSRIAYLGVEFIPLSGDNSIRLMTIEGKAARINHADGEINVILPVKNDFTVNFELNHTDAVANFKSGTRHNFAKGPLIIKVTAPNEEIKIYTVSIQLPKPLDGENVINDIHFGDASKWDGRIYTEGPNIPVVKTTGNMDLEPDANPIHPDCGTVGQLRFIGSDATATIVFDEPVDKLTIWARATSITSAALIEIICEDNNGEPLWNEVMVLGIISDSICGMIVKETIQEPCVVRIRRLSGSGSFGILRILAERAGVEPVSLSDDNTLNSLTVTGLVRVGEELRALELTPAFDPAVTDYVLRVNNVGNNVTIAAKANNKRAFIMADDLGKKHLVSGKNTFRIRIFAEDGSPKVYTVTVDHYALKKIIITFDPGMFKLPPDAESSMTVLHEHTIGNLPVPSITEGFTFHGWFTQKEGGIRIDEHDICHFEKNITLYARYHVPVYTVTFKSNMEESSYLPSVMRKHGEAVGKLFQPDNRENYLFVGWWDNPGFEGEPYTADTLVMGNVTLYALWVLKDK